MSAKLVALATLLLPVEVAAADRSTSFAHRALSGSFRKEQPIAFVRAAMNDLVNGTKQEIGRWAKA
jgi:hypothetical protein